MKLLAGHGRPAIGNLLSGHSLTAGGPNGAALIPALTADTDQGWTVAASSVFSTFSAYKAFTGVGDTSNYWLSNTGWNPATLSMTAPAAVRVFSYDVGAGTPQARYPTAWTLQGSDNGTDWTTYDTQTGQTFIGVFQTNTYTLSASALHQYWKLVFTANNGDSRIAASLVQLYS